jgi:hypothetical protein
MTVVLDRSLLRPEGIIIEGEETGYCTTAIVPRVLECVSVV